MPLFHGATSTAQTQRNYFNEIKPNFKGDNWAEASQEPDSEATIRINKEKEPTKDLDTDRVFFCKNSKWENIKDIRIILHPSGSYTLFYKINGEEEWFTKPLSKPMTIRGGEFSGIIAEDFLTETGLISSSFNANEWGGLNIKIGFKGKEWREVTDKTGKEFKEFCNNEDINSVRLFRPINSEGSQTSVQLFKDGRVHVMSNSGTESRTILTNGKPPASFRGKLNAYLGGFLEDLKNAQ